MKLEVLKWSCLRVKCFSKYEPKEKNAAMQAMSEYFNNNTLKTQRVQGWFGVKWKAKIVIHAGKEVKKEAPQKKTFLWILKHNENYSCDCKSVI